MAAVVSLRELVDELKILTSEHHAFLDQVTGKIIIITDEDISTVENGDSVEGRQEWEQEIFEQTKKVLSSNDYLELPSRFDIHEYNIIERFCSSFPDEQISEELLDKIRGGSGAFRRFKDTISRYGIEQEWFKFQDEAYREIVISWLKHHKFAYSER